MSGATTVRIATFNVRNGLALDGRSSWPVRRGATAAAIGGLDADVAGLQEVYPFQQRWLTRRLHGYRAVGKGRNDGRRGERCPLLYRPPCELVTVATRWFADDPDTPGGRLPGASFPRVATLGVFERDGRRFGVANVHLDEHRAENRVTSTRMLLGWLPPEIPWVIVGDFNEEVDGPAVGVLLEAGYRSALGPDAPGTNHDFTGRTDGARIDHVLVGLAWAIDDARVVTDRPGGRLPSDHWPVVADLRLSS